MHRDNNLLPGRATPPQPRLSAKISLFVAAIVACLLLSARPALAAASKGMIGFNWPDIRDNYSNDLLVPSGLVRTDTQAVIEAKTARIVHQAHGLSGANTFRMPINYLMTQNDAAAADWWTKYCAAVDKITGLGFKVILCPWHIRQTYADGTSAYVNIPFAPNSSTHATSTAQMFDNIKYFWDMWAVVVAKYSGNSKVYFEIWNEPGQCTKDEWTAICNEWLRRYPATTVPRNRVIIDGGGWAEYVGWMAYNPAFDDCLLAYHTYGNLKDFTTEAEWVDYFDFCMGVDTANYPSSAAAILSRVIVDEYGSTGKGTNDDYSNPANTAAPVVFMRALDNYMRTHDMGGTGWAMCGAAPVQIWNSGAGSTTPFLYVNNTTYFSSFIEGFDLAGYSGTFKIRNKRDTTKYLYRNGTDINAAPDWGQTWVSTNAGNGFYRIHASGTSPAIYLCATSTAFSGTPTNNLSLAARTAVYNSATNTYDPPADSLWKIVDQGDGSVKLWNKSKPNYCVHYTLTPLSGSNYQYQVNNEYTANNIGDYASWVMIKQ